MSSERPTIDGLSFEEQVKIVGQERAEKRRDKIAKIQELNKRHQLAVERQENSKETKKGAHEFIVNTYREHNVPVDKFGHFYSDGGNTVDDLPLAQFNDLDYILAVNLYNKGLLEMLVDGKKIEVKKSDRTKEEV